MEKGERNEQHKAHCLILPLPIQGHINPMLQLAKRLHQKGIKTTLLVTKYLAKTIHFSSSVISLETIADGFADGMSPDDFMARFREAGPTDLKEIVERLAGSGPPVGCIIYDPFLPWVLEVAEELGLMAAAFFTQSCAVLQIYYQVYKRELRVPISGDDEILIPGIQVPLEPQDMPSLVHAHGSNPPVFKMILDQFLALEKAHWLFFNTFYELEQEVIDYMLKIVPMKAIGPTIPSMYLDKRLPDDREYELSICIEWLNGQKPESVVYVSFGSIAELEEEQMEELACGLRLSNKHFLWVVRSSEASKLPKNFAQETSRKGLIVSWCPQLDVLAHKAICCFLTHCGWNSILEALSLGVPMVGMPRWSDQSTNAKFVTDVWKVGTRVQTNNNGLVSREAIARCIREVMDGEKGEEIKKNAIRWRESARKTMEKDGSSDGNIEEFVSTLYSNCLQMSPKGNTELDPKK